MVEVYANNRDGITYEKCSEPWKFINKQVQRSKIRRYNWEAIFGMKLTKAILLLKMQHISKDQVVSELINNENMKNIFMNDPELYSDMCNKIKISVYARFGENNSSTRLYMQVKNHNLKQEKEAS
jgi:hypothetical protein